MAKRKKSSKPAKPKVQTLDIEDLKAIIRKARSGALSDDDCKSLKDTVETLAWLHHQLDEHTLTIAALRKLFGITKSEKMKDVFGDKDKEGTGGDSEDNSEDDSGGDSEDENDSEDDSEKSKKTPKPKKPGHGRKSADDYEGAKRVEVKNDSLKRGDPCPVCPTNKQGKVYQVKQPKNLVRIVGQAPLQATIYELEKLRCNLCGEIFVAQPPPGVGDKKYDATAAAMIGLLKYGGGMPFYRLANLQSSLKIPLPVSTQWDVINAAQAELEPAYKELLRQAAQGHLVYNDDTTMRVLDLRKTIDELNKAGKTDRKGIFTTGIISEIAQGRRVALYFTGRNHAGENLAEVLALRAKALDAPMQMCDALDCNVTGDFETILSNCLTHARRKFVEVATRFPAECSHVLKQLGQVYANDAKARQEKMSDQERLVHHQTHSSTTMTDLKIWMDEKIDKKLVEPNSPLGAAIAYMTKRWEKFTVFLRLPGAPLDNNITERALKKAILHRKNALFYKTEHGAKTGDIFMSLIQTADAAGSNPFDYLVALLTNQSAVVQYPERWMPWNYEAALADAKASVCEVSA